MTSAIVIDDFDDFLYSFSALLESHDIKIVGQGHDGKDAVNLYLEFRPDVIFLDIIMPTNDGITALKIIKKLNKDAKVIVVTADLSLDTHKKLDSLGVTDIIHKPVNIRKVLKIISK